jgi:hypothetical protein
MPDPTLTPAPATPVPAPATPVPAPQPAPASAGASHAAVLTAFKLYAASAIGAFLLGLTDYVRHGTDSTVVALNNGLAALDPRIDLILVILLMTPVMGVIAAWIFKPTTERDAFALGFAVFSLFALVPEQPEEAAVEEIGVSPEAEDVSFRFIAPAFAGQEVAEGGSALLLLDYEGEPPPSTEVSVSNLTKGQWLGTYQVMGSLQLVGAPGDRVQLAIEAPGYERTRIELTLQEAGESYTVQLQESGTPLFIQRLAPATRSVAMPSGEWRGMDAAGASSTTTATGAAAAPVE